MEAVAAAYEDLWLPPACDRKSFCSSGVLHRGCSAREHRNQCTITKELEGRARHTLQQSLVGVSMHVLRVEWILALGNLWICNQGHGRQPWHPTVSDYSSIESET